ELKALRPELILRAQSATPGPLLGSGEIDVRVQAVGRVVTRNQVDAAGIDDVQATEVVEADLEKVAEVEVAGRRGLDRIDQRVGRRAAELRRDPGINVPVAVDRGVGLIADSDRPPIAGDIDPD